MDSDRQQKTGSQEAATNKWKPIKEGLFPWPLPEDRSAGLIGSRCRKCGQTFFPQRALCPECRDRGEMEERRLSRKGVLYSYTIIRQAPPGFKAPYAIALVDLPEGVRLFARLTTVDPSLLRIGQALELTFGPIAQDQEGNPIISYLFEPTGGGGK